MILYFEVLYLLAILIRRLDNFSDNLIHLRVNFTFECDLKEQTRTENIYYKNVE